MAEKISLDESFEYSLHNFSQWLEIITLEPIELCNAWGNYNVAWEIVSDLNTDGIAAISNPCSYLDVRQKQAIQDFLASLGGIPKSVLVGAASIVANQEAMSHPCWLPFKTSAIALIKTLEPAATRNKEYFSTL
ncbi:MAG: hypothetical protein R3F04_11065 [Lysobacteraceae bacterium]